MGLLWFVIIGAVAGWLAGQFMKGSGFGLLGDIVVGVIGAFLGGYLFRAVGVSLGGGLVGSLIVAFIGAVVLLFVVRLFTSRRSGRRLWS
ncbi:MAG TPA: GlsB/YeaQ/YmgE family stress response membrane protein [Thermoanaerobaculia bacterium]|nr:GlsB/YeaQ/YmgE family stress response membrane protein [Thermoanaerobaculia bacterium]